MDHSCFTETLSWFLVSKTLFGSWCANTAHYLCFVSKITVVEERVDFYSSNVCIHYQFYNECDTRQAKYSLPPPHRSTYIFIFFSDTRFIFESLVFGGQRAIIYIYFFFEKEKYNRNLRAAITL